MAPLSLREIVELLDGVVLCGEAGLDNTVSEAFSSDLMSDVLAFSPEGTVLITGLTNVQVIRTCEISGISAVVFVRGKLPERNVIEQAEQFGLPLIGTRHSMFDACGLMFKCGLCGFSTTEQAK